MLTGDLVRCTVKEGKVKPGFISHDTERHRERAADILACVKASVGRRRVDIEEDLEGILGDAVDQKLFAGMAKLVFDACDFSTQATIPPRELRQKVWLESARRGPLSMLEVEGVATAADVYAAVGAELGMEAAAIPDAIYADLPSEQRLVNCSAEGSEWLIDRYNLALVQALLYSATHVDVEVRSPTPARARQLLRAVKFNQLCFSASQEGESLFLRIDGPASLFSQTTRYGLALAKFLPTLVLQPSWSLSATVEVKRWKPKLIVDQDTGLRSHHKDIGAYETREAEWFRERFEALESGWTIDRDPLPLVQGNDGVVVPDFSFRKGGKVAHLEILGFWRKGSIAGRFSAMKKHGPTNLVLAVSKRYCVGEEEELPEQVVPFAEVIPAKQVLERLEKLARRG